jgi:hypothetical protein
MGRSAPTLHGGPHAQAVGQFFAPAYVFINARGQRLSRADRLASLRTGRPAVDTVARAPEEEQFQSYGDVILRPDGRVL